MNRVHLMLVAPDNASMFPLGGFRTRGSAFIEIDVRDGQYNTLTDTMGVDLRSSKDDLELPAPSNDGAWVLMVFGQELVDKAYQPIASCLIPGAARMLDIRQVNEEGKAIKHNDMDLPPLNGSDHDDEGDSD